MDTAAQDTVLVGDTSLPADVVTTSAGDETDASSADCGGFSASDVAAAVGTGDIDSVEDVSIDTDVTCLFYNEMSGFAVTVAAQATSDYLGGALDGSPIDETLAALESSAMIVLADGAVATRINSLVNRRRSWLPVLIRFSVIHGRSPARSSTAC